MLLKCKHVQDLSLTKCAGLCLSSYMLVVIPVVAMLMGLGLLEGVDLILTPWLGRAALSALPGLEAELFSREMPRTGNWLVGSSLTQNSRLVQVWRETIQTEMLVVLTLEG